MILKLFFFFGVYVQGSILLNHPPFPPPQVGGRQVCPPTPVWESTCGRRLTCVVRVWVFLVVAGVALEIDVVVLGV